MAVKQDPSLQLGPFMRDVAVRLEALSHDQLKALLLQHARGLHKGQRASFLNLLSSSPHPDAAEKAGSMPDDDGAALLEEIDGFVKSLEEGEYYEGWGWDRDIMDERAWGDESWADTMDDLFDQAGEAFLQHDWPLARQAYRKLLEAFFLEEETGAFCGPADATEMVETDLTEAKARYLRVLYETSLAEERAPLLWEALADLRYIGDSTLDLSAVDAAWETPLPGLKSFLTSWIATLKEVKPTRYGENSGSFRKSLLRQAVTMAEGASGLKRLARAEGGSHPEAYQAWTESLKKEGDLPGALAAAQEGVERAPDGEVRSQLAATLAELAVRQGDQSLAVQARQKAWRSAPHLSRLLAYCAEGDPDADQLDARLQEEHNGRKGKEYSPDKRLSCLLAFLTGDYAWPVQQLKKSKPLGWSGSEHPGWVVFPILLRLASGAEPLPSGSRLAKLWNELDIHLESSFVSLPGLPRSGGESGKGCTKLLESAFARRPPSEMQRQDFLEAARVAAKKRTGEILSKKLRRAYERAALLAVAYAEACTISGDQKTGMRFIEGLLSEYSRFYAFRNEMEALLRSSPLLPNPAPKRR